MTYRDETDMGGTGRTFLTTHWSLIEDAGSNEERNRALIGLLFERYWKPVYFYLRRKGHKNDEAKDLTQGFFCEVVLGRNLVQRADPGRGRFRSFLLYALDKYLIDQFDKQAAAKRIPRNRLISIDSLGPWDLPAAVSESSPGDSYNYGWVAALLDQALSHVKARCDEQGMEVHWKVFYERIVRPTLEGAECPSLADVCERYGIEGKKKASNMLVTTKRCFQAALRECVRNTVAREEEIEEELGEIVCFLPGDAQHSSE